MSKTSKKISQDANKQSTLAACHSFLFACFPSVSLGHVCIEGFFKHTKIFLMQLVRMWTRANLPHTFVYVYVCRSLRNAYAFSMFVSTYFGKQTNNAFGSKT